MARMAQSVPDKVDRPGRVMTRDYDNRSRIPSSARCTSSPPLLLALPFVRGPYSPPRYLSYPLFRFFHLFTSLPSHPPSTPSPSLPVARFGSRHPSSPVLASFGYCLSTRSLYSTLFIYRALLGYVFFISYCRRIRSPCDPLCVRVLDINRKFPLL